MLTLLGLSGALLLLPIVVVLFIAGFELAMFVHVIRNANLSDDRKLLWIVGMLLVHPFVAIGYYVTDRKAGP